MKELKRILFIITLFITFISTGQAKTITKGSYIPSMYIKSSNTNNSRYLQSQFIMNKTDNKVVYCLEPFILFKENTNYTELNNSQSNKLNIDEETFKKVETIAYFGYNFNNHTDSKWYSITQVLIWRTISPSSTINFTSSLNGNITTAYDDEIKELEDLVNNYLSNPSFNNQNINLNLNESTTLDINDYKINEDEFISGTTGLITINGTSNTNKTYELSKGSDNNTVYFSDSSQSLIESTSPGLKTAKINLSVTSSRLNISFIHENEIYSNCISNNENTYGLYNSSKQIIASFKESDQGYLSDELPLATYYIKQITTACDTRPIDRYNMVVLNKNNSQKDYDIYINKIIKTVSLKKYYGYNDIYLPEPNAKFLLTDGKNSFALKTNELGQASINMGVGNYQIKQISGIDNYNFIKDIDLKITTDSEDIINMNLYNEIKKANVTIHTIDQEGNDLSDIKVCIYDSNNVLKECTTSTNNVTNFLNYPLGEYHIEVSELDSYTIDNTKENLIIKNTENSVTFIYNKIIKKDPDIPPKVEEPTKDKPILEEPQDQDIHKEIEKNDQNIETIFIPNTFANDYLLLIGLIIFIIIIYEKR